MQFSHEKLDAYKVSIEFLEWTARIIEEVQRGNSSLIDQLKRAALSIPLNIAEAVGKPSSADRSRFYAIARGSAFECAAILDACRTFKIVAEQEVEIGKRKLVRVVSMLSKLCR